MDPNSSIDALADRIDDENESDSMVQIPKQKEPPKTKSDGGIIEGDKAPNDAHLGCAATKQKQETFVPFVINKRPKDDVSPPKAANEMMMTHEVNKPNITLFENMQIIENCNKINDDNNEETKNEEDVIVPCPSMGRMVAVLDYYNALVTASESGEMNTKLREELFVNFCDEHYGEQMMLEDYMHCVEHHGDRESIAKMASALKWKCSVGSKRCGGTRRHFRDRKNTLESIHFYVDTMDTMHFNVLHLEDVGLRVYLDLNKSELVENEDGLVDDHILKISNTIRSKREQHFVDRRDHTAKNGKFSLCSDLGNMVQSEEGRTEMDLLKEGLMKKAEREQMDIKSIDNQLRNFMKFQEEQQYDTDTVQEDMKVFAEEGHSNVAERLKNDKRFFIMIRKMLQYLRVSRSSFSTGKWFMYWDWYRTEEGRKEVMKGGNWKEIDFGGHSVESLCVYPHFKNLEEEVLSSGVITKENWLKILEKAARFMKTSRCKKMKSTYWGAKYYLYYDIPFSTVIAVHHLIALLLYTDFSAFCTALSETFRAIFGGETIDEINGRNSRFYWSSRYLRELVTCFGSWSFEEAELFWCGISFPLQIPQFQIGLIGPTSTSMAKEVALKFAGERGMMIKLKGGDSLCFNAAPFSCYPEEEERIFCGSHRREELVTILMVKTAKNYKAALTAFSAFDAIFSGNKINKYEMSALDLEIIKESLRWIEGGEDAVNHKKLDLFILETFYSFILHKKMISLSLEQMSKVKEKEIINFVMNPLWNKWYDQRRYKRKDSNLMKPFAFNLFRHVHTIRIDAHDYPFDFILFLRMLQSVDLPETLRLIIIEDSKPEIWATWIDKEFNKVKEECAAANIECELVNCYTLYFKI